MQKKSENYLNSNSCTNTVISSVFECPGDDEIYGTAAVRDLLAKDAVFKSVINNKLKDFPK